ncbi:MAG: S1 family peptidase [Archangium sp.]
MRALLLVAALFTTACGVERTSSQTRHGIYGGTAAPDDDAVFFLELETDTDAGTSCSAVLIAPRTLLTAAHCVDPAAFGAQSVRVRATNRSPADAGTRATLDTVRLHPEWNVAKLENDVALLLLPAPSNTPPLPWNARSLSGRTDLEVRAVGYGRDETGESGVRRSARMPVLEVTSSSLRIGDLFTRGICFGDSGGPSLLVDDGVERVVGIHSAARSSACTDGYDARVDEAAHFIRAWLAEFEEPCLPNGLCAETSCAVPDPDCATLGDRCETESDCPGRACITDSQHADPYCSRPCNEGTACEPLVCDVRRARCVFTPLVDVAPLGSCTPGQSFCTGDTQCINGRCVRPCVTDDDCLNGTCVLHAAGLQSCAPPRITLPFLGVATARNAGCSTGSGLLTFVALLMFQRRRLR